MALGFPTELELEVLVFVEGGKPGNQEKNPQSKRVNQWQTQPTYDDGGYRIQTRATLVESECSHPCAISAPRYLREDDHM